VAHTRLRDTATHRNTLQHTATHCDTLQHTATHCNTLQHTATHCNTLHQGERDVAHTRLSDTHERFSAKCNEVQSLQLRCVELEDEVRVAACCSVLQCVAVGCSVLQWVAVCCSVL